MINKITIKGWRSLSDINNLELKPLNVLIGPNGSGKTNTLDIFQFFSEAAKGYLLDGIMRRGGWEEVHFKGDDKEDISFEFDFSKDPDFFKEGGIKFCLSLTKKGFYPLVGKEKIIKSIIKGHHTTAFEIVYRDLRVCKFANAVAGISETPGEKKEMPKDTKTVLDESELAIFQYQDNVFYPTPSKLLKLLKNWEFYRPIWVGAGSPVREPQLLKPGTLMEKNGSNLYSVLFNLQQNHPDKWSEINELLKAIYPDFKYLSLPPEGGDGKIVLRWWEKHFEQKYFTQQNLSDGILRWLCLLAILKNPNPPSVICIDEPELSMHPQWIKVLGDLIKETSQRTQLFIATHSPELVARLEANDIILIDKINGESFMRHPNNEELKKWLDEFHLGDLWRMNVMNIMDEE
jgi:predicted ATPase